MSRKDDLTGIEEFSKSAQGEGDSHSEPSLDSPLASSDEDLFPVTEPEAQLPETQPDHAPTDQLDQSDTDFEPIGSMIDTPEIASPEPERMTPEAGEIQSDHPLEQVRRYAEQLTERRDGVPAAYPFSLIIEGILRPEEKEKLLDVLSREQMGIREVDLEPQFESGRVLIPRISEYAAVVLIQALRGIGVSIQAGPSDEVFSTPDTRDDSPGYKEPKQQRVGMGADHPAESLPITGGPSIPWITSYRVIGVLTASATLQSTAVETESSSEYLELLESLQRELRYRAFHKGATAILDYSVQLSPLQLSRHYRVSVSGTAIKS